MIYKHVAFDFSEIVEKIENHDIIFVFLDALSNEMQKIAKKNETIDDIIFVDYRDQSKYIVNINSANKILKFCYEKIYLEPTLNNIDIGFETNNKLFLIKSIFLLLKSIRDFDAKLNNIMFKNLLLEISEDLIFLDDKEYILYRQFIEKSNFDIKFLMNKFEPFLSISINTFVFSNSFEFSWHYSRIEAFHQIKNYLNYSLLKKKKHNNYYINIILKYFILISFINAKYYHDYLNHYDDNIYMKHSIVYIEGPFNLPFFLRKDAYFPTIC